MWRTSRWKPRRPSAANSRSNHHPPKVLDKVKKIFELLRSGERDQVPMWFKSERLGKFVYVTYAAVRDDQGDFQGVLEYVQDIQPFFELKSDLKRDID